MNQLRTLHSMCQLKLHTLIKSYLQKKEKTNGGYKHNKVSHGIFNLMRNLIAVLVTAVGFLFLLKLKWPKNKTFYLQKAFRSLSFISLFFFGNSVLFSNWAWKFLEFFHLTLKWF